jgi:SOS response regulatory protein OraA/RecX
MITQESEMNAIYTQALKLLAIRDFTAAELRRKLEGQFGNVPEDVIDQLVRQNFLNDRRFVENYVSRRREKGAVRLREALIARGVAGSLVDEILARTDWPSLKQALTAKMNDWNLRTPLQPRDVTRLFRALARLGYDEDAIREEVEQLHEQQ